MNKDISFKNFAFISYCHADKKAAEELQKVLDDFHLSDALKEKYPDRPEVLREIFRDDTGLPAGSNLTKEIQKQLEQSNYLIVICSPNAAKSEWVNKEIDYFKTHRDSTHIIPFIIDGVANARNANDQECFPTALKSLEARGANISTFSFERAVIEVIAGALEIDVDDLWQRHVRAEEAKKRQLKEQRDNLLRVQSRFLAEKANALTTDYDGYVARLLALEALPQDIDKPERPYVEEAVSALWNATSSDNFVLIGHDDSVSSATFSHNDRYVVSTSHDKTVKIWDVRTGLCIKSLEGHTDIVRCAFFSLDDKCIITACNDKAVRIYDVDSGVCIKTIPEIFNVNSYGLLCVHPNGKEFLISTDNDELRLIDIETGICKLTIKGEAEYDYANFKTALYSPDGRYIASQEDISSIQMRNAENGDIIYTMNSGVSPLMCFNDSGFLFASSDISNINVFRTDTGEGVMQFRGHNSIINGLCFIPHSNLLASSDGEDVRIWNRMGDCIRIIPNIKTFGPLSCSNDGRYVLVPMGHKCVAIDIQGNSITHKLDSANEEHVSDLDKGRRYIAMISRDKRKLTIRRTDDGKVFNICDFEVPVEECLFSPNGKSMIVSTRNSISLWVIGETSPVKSIPLKSSRQGRKYASFSHNGNEAFIIVDDSKIMAMDSLMGKRARVVVENKWSIGYIDAGYEGWLIYADWLDEVFVLDMKDSANVKKFKCQSHTLFKKAVMNPRRKQIVLISEDYDKKYAILWDMESGKCLYRFLIENINDVTFSDNGEWLAIRLANKETWILNTGTLEHISLGTEKRFVSFAPDKNIMLQVHNFMVEIVDLDENSVLNTIEHNDSLFEFVGFSYDGKRFLSKEIDVIYVWDTQSGKCIRTINVGKEISFATWNNDSTRILSFDCDRKMQIWFMPSINQLINETRERFKNRQLTPEERKKYYLD